MAPAGHEDDRDHRRGRSRRRGHDRAVPRPFARNAGGAAKDAERVSAAGAGVAAVHGLPGAARARAGRARGYGGPGGRTRDRSVHGRDESFAAGGRRSRKCSPVSGPYERQVVPLMKVVLDHVGIAVNDLAASLAFYRDVLGLEVEAPEEVASQHVRAHFIPLGDERLPGAPGVRLELLEATSPESPIATYLGKRGP